MAAPDATLSLARALIDTSYQPLLLFDGDLRVVGASRSFCTAFHLPRDAADGQALADLGGGEWDIPQLRSLLENALRDGPGIGPYETDLAGSHEGVRRLILNVQKVNYDDRRNPRVLLAIDDVTDLRRADRLTSALLVEKDDLLRERSMLLQEMQHRVANSLQIIASILLLKARAVQSEETRGHLRDAHDRVISIAAVQQHLQSGIGDVEVGPYLTKLGRSLAASMIGEARPLTIEVRADKGSVTSHKAVSLGLVVTELVINALKHAFPEGRGGLVVVGYDVNADGWTLSVTDDGVGRPMGAAAAKSGLGTSVVQALARQLGSRVVISDAEPGARVALVSVPAPLAPTVGDTSGLSRAREDEVGGLGYPEWDVAKHPESIPLDSAIDDPAPG